MIKQNNNSNIKLFGDNIDCNINLSEIKEELLILFKSPNPIYIYLNSQKIKEKFSQFLICLSKKIVAWFKIEDTDDITFMKTIYKQTNYDKVWIDILELYLKESKNFDLLNYLFYVKILNKDKQIIARTLLKMYLHEEDTEIKDFLNTYSNITFDKIQKIYNDFDIKLMKFNINIKEDFVEHFIEKIYLQLPETKRDLFLDNFILKIDKNNLDFWDVSKVLTKVIYSYGSLSKRNQLQEIISNEYFKEIKDMIDIYVKDYKTLRWDFYVKISQKLEKYNLTDRNYLWQYIKMSIIDKHFPGVKYLFYDYSSNVFVDKNIYTLLKWEFKIIPSISPESEYIYSEYKEIQDLKEIILELSNNLFSFFLLPIIYYTISEKLSIQKKDLYKMEYLLLFILSKNYSEYKKIYMFFNQLEVFINYESKSRVLEKIQVSFSIILAVFLFLVLAYLYMPIWVFLWVFILAFIKYFEVVYPTIFYKLKWNVWIKFFAIVFLSVSTYFWFMNFDKVKEDTQVLSKQVEFLWTISSKEIIDNWFKYIKASILEFWKK